MQGGYSFRQDLRTTVQVKADPLVVLTSSIIALNSQEIETMIQQELSENPALERIDESDEVEHHPESPEDQNKVDWLDYESYRSAPIEDTEFQMIDLACSSSTLQESLWAQMQHDCPAEEAELIQYLIDCVSDAGYFTSTIEEVALACNRSLEQAELWLTKLQQCEPAGVASRTVQECLILQLEREGTEIAKLAAQVVETQLDDLINRNYVAISNRLRIPPMVAKKAVNLVTSLNPYPGENSGFAPSESRPVVSRAVPEVIFQHNEQGWHITVMGSDPTSFVISREYVNRSLELERAARPDKSETRHLNYHINRASRFLSALHQRKRSIEKIANYLVETQSGFIMTGNFKYLTDITRSKLAKVVGVHESTVSRATNGKYVQICTGEVVSFDFFFDSSLRVKHMIQEILSHENPSSPLSDSQIQGKLAERGLEVARRTVHKYREKTLSLSSRKRKSA